MSKHYDLPQSRLICMGGARALTNAPKGEREIEDDPQKLYNP